MTSPERRRLVEDLFARATALAPEERGAFLARACPDAELRAEVAALLDPNERGDREAPPTPTRSAGPLSLTLLYLVGRGLLDGLGDPARLARGAWWTWWRLRDKDGRQAELRGVASASAEELRRGLVQVVLDLTADRPAQVRQPLADALAGVARSLRRGQAPDNADDLRAALPESLPRLADAPPPEPAIVLRVTAGPQAGREFRFTGHDTFLVGRSQQAHFNLGPDDRYFSRVHFMVEANPPQARLVDMGSHNGTRLNGQRVTAAVALAEGDRIQAGHTILVVSLPGAVALAVPPLPPPTMPAQPRTTGWKPATPQGPCRVCNPGGGRALPICAACEAQMLSQPPLIPGYRTVRELGRGGMGVVCLAVREQDGAVLAIKTVTPAMACTPDLVERFLREARILEALDHPNVVAFREMGEAGGLLYFAMDYVPGRDLARLLHEEGPLPVERAVGLVAQVLQALDYAHAKRFVHRDVKPANVLLGRRQGEEHAWLADFGLARVYQASQLSGLTMTGAVGGTPTFMPPEQVTNYREATPAADQYSVAATLYNLLTGSFTHDFADSVHGRLNQLLHEDPVPIQERREDVPDALAAAIHKALSRKPGRRFTDAKAFRRALLAAVR